MLLFWHAAYYWVALNLWNYMLTCKILFKKAASDFCWVENITLKFVTVVPHRTLTHYHVFNLAINFLAWVFKISTNISVYQVLLKQPGHPVEFLINKLNLFWTCIPYLHESFFNFWKLYFDGYKSPEKE